MEIIVKSPLNDIYSIVSPDVDRFDSKRKYSRSFVKMRQLCRVQEISRDQNTSDLLLSSFLPFTLTLSLPVFFSFISFWSSVSVRVFVLKSN